MRRLFRSERARGAALERALLAFVLFVWLVLLPWAARAAQSVTYVDEGGTRWCATLNYVGPGADGERWGWITMDADPRRAFHVPMAKLIAGLDGCMR